MSEITDQLKRLLERAAQLAPSKEEADHVKQFSEQFCQGHGHGKVFENPRLLPIIQAQVRVIERLSEALKCKCMCWDEDDPRSERNPCHACTKLALSEQELERVMK